MATIQTLKIDEAVTISNDNGDSNNSGKLPEEETGNHSTSDEITPRFINGAPSFADVYSVVYEDNGELLDDTELESEVTSFISDYQNKELYELVDIQAVVLSKLRSLYKIYSAKISRVESINDGILTKYGIRKGMLLNIEKNLLRMEGKQWINHYTQTYGRTSLRSAQDYMALARIPKILEHVEFGKERLMGALRAIRILKIKSDDPIATILQQYGISFNPEESQFEGTMMDLKLGIDYAVAISKIKKAEEKQDVNLGVNADLIKQLIVDGIAVNGEFINDLFEINNERRDVNSHLESLCSDNGDGDEILPHIKKVNGLPNLIVSLKETVDSVTQHNALAGRIEQDYINDLENCVADLKNLVENGSAAG